MRRFGSAKAVGLMPRLAMILLGAVIAFAVLLPLNAQMVAAQTSEPTQALDELSEIVDGALADPATSEVQLSTWRRQAVELRDAAAEQQDKTAPLVETIQGQIDALGPLPEEGDETEAAAAERAALAARLQEADGPRLAAERGFRRAQALVDQIDTQMRERRAQRLTRLGPTPLNPANWTTALGDIAAFKGGIAGALAAQLNEPQARRDYLGRLPFATLLGLVAGVLAFVGIPRVTAAFSRAAAGQSAARRFAFVGYGRNLARLLLAALVGYALVLALRQANPGGLPLSFGRSALPNAAMWFGAAYFVAHGLFGEPDTDLALINRGSRENRRARRLIEGLGAVLAGSILIDGLTASVDFDDTSRAVLFFPLCLIGVFLLWPLARLLQTTPAGAAAARFGPDSTAMLVLRWFARIATIAALASPVLAAIGYLNLAKFLFVPTISTFVFIGGLLVIFGILTETLDQFAAVEGRVSEFATRSSYQLLPVVLGILTIAFSVPMLALIWGAQTTDLQSAWAWMSAGVPIGEARLSLTDFLTFIVVFAIGYAITRSIKAAVRGSVLPRTTMDIGARNAVLAGIGYIGVFITALVAISSTGLDLSNLAIVAGALSVGIGFGLQAIVSNFVSGIILLIERPIKQGDWIEVAGHAGYVRHISVRSTLIDTFDKSTVIVPNAELIAGTVLNRTHSNMTGRVVVTIGAGYGSDPKVVAEILKEIAASHEQIIQMPPPFVMFRGFGADALDFEIRAQIKDVNNGLGVTSDLNFAISERFAAEGIEIPFAQRDVTIKNLGELGEIIARG